MNNKHNNSAWVHIYENNTDINVVFVRWLMDTPKHIFLFMTFSPQVITYNVCLYHKPLSQ